MPMSTDAFRFGEFTIDVARARVSRGEAEISLRPKSFALLHYLVTHADRLVTKDELFSALWPGLVVTDDSLTRCVSEVRTALGDGAANR
jgi:adenylate cyclase